ncbi:MAG: hypothetical protein KG003_08020 [Bacteroidetes bacterium]|nr:hypothetical protein [Bacteroidota bacterium]
MEKIQKTRIEKVSDLKPGDVIYKFERWSYEKNLKAEKPLPVINFHRIFVISNVHLSEGGKWLFDYRKHDRLSSSNGDHLKVIRALAERKVCEGGTFGCNQRIPEKGEFFHSEIWRLDTIRNSVSPSYNYSGVILYKNPAYDLMH